MLATERSLSVIIKMILLTQLTVKERFKLKELNVFREKEHHLN